MWLTPITNASKFSLQGNFLRMFEFVIGGQQSVAPYCIAIDTNNMIYLSIFANEHICMFTSEGQFVTSFGRGLENPRGLAVDNSGVLYVCDSNCVQLF